LFAAVLWVVGKYIFRFNLPYRVDYGVFLIVGLLPWTFLATALLDASQSFVQNASLIRKVYFPRMVFPLAAVGANLVNFLLGVLAIFGTLSLLGFIPFSSSMLLLPGLILLQTFLVLGLSFIVSISNVFFRDTAMILEFVLQAWFYLTPIIYPISYVLNRDEMVATGLARVYPLLNPMAPIIHAYRRCLLGGVELLEPSAVGTQDLFLYLGASFLWGCLILGIGVLLYRRYRGGIADEV
jgi:ABC-type polysaccharide/polyol phosphate export permease